MIVNDNYSDYFFTQKLKKKPRESGLTPEILSTVDLIIIY